MKRQLLPFMAAEAPPLKTRREEQGNMPLLLLLLLVPVPVLVLVVVVVLVPVLVWA